MSFLIKLQRKNTLENLTLFCIHRTFLGVLHFRAANPTHKSPKTVSLQKRAVAACAENTRLATVRLSCFRKIDSVRRLVVFVDSRLRLEGEMVSIK